MGLDIAHLAGNTAEVEFEIAGETGHVTYRPNDFTAERLERIDDRQAEDQEFNNFTLFLAEVLVDWDVMRGNKKVPIEPAEIDALPLPLLKLIYVSMIRDIGDGEAGKASNGRSRPRDHLEKSPSGTRSSKPRATSGSRRGTS